MSKITVREALSKYLHREIDEKDIDHVKFFISRVLRDPKVDGMLERWLTDRIKPGIYKEKELYDTYVHWTQNVVPWMDLGACTQKEFEDTLFYYMKHCIIDWEVTLTNDGVDEGIIYNVTRKN